MHKLYTPLAVCAALAIATAAHADDYANLTVTGTINPQACTPSLSNATLDFGSKNYSELSETEWTLATPQTTTLTITCPSPTATQWKWSDNAQHSVSEGGSTIPGLGNGWYFGTEPQLQSGGSPALFEVDLGTPTADGEAATCISRYEDNQTPAAWSPTVCTHIAANVSAGIVTNFAYGVGSSGANPVPHTVVTWPMTVKVAYNNRQKLALQDDLTFNGSATFTVYYL